MFLTYQRWALDVPDDFQFSIKLSKEITHGKKLAFEPSTLSKFIQAASGLGDKNGCLLLQFPGSLTLDYYNEVERILEAIDAESESQWRKAVEFRHTSWYTGETYELLQQYKAVIVLHDFKKAKLSEDLANQDFVYLRFHGPKGDYRDSYEDAILKSHAKQISAWLKEGKDVYAYFNNTIGKAYENAMSLRKLLT